MAFEFTDDNFQIALESEGVVVIDCWAEWCGPCRAISPIIEELHMEYQGKALVGKLNVDDNPEISNQFGIRNIPTILILKNGEVRERHIGYTTKQILAYKIQAHL